MDEDERTTEEEAPSLPAPEVSVTDATVVVEPVTPETPSSEMDAVYRLGRLEPSMAELQGRVNQLGPAVEGLNENVAVLLDRVEEVEAETDKLEEQVAPEQQTPQAKRAWWETMF